MRAYKNRTLNNHVFMRACEDMKACVHIDHTYHCAYEACKS